MLNKAKYLQPIETANLNKSVYEVLRIWICNANLAPGQRINLSEIEELLQVSRTPIKMALKQLELEGLVEIQPRRGTFIASLDADIFDANFKIRSSFELYVAQCLFNYLDDEDYEFFVNIRSQMEKLATGNVTDELYTVITYLKLDRDFHGFLVKVGGPNRMYQLYKQNDTHAYMLRLAQDYNLNDLKIIHQEHLQIFESLLTQSAETLSESLLLHLEAERHRALTRLTSTTDKSFE